MIEHLIRADGILVRRSIEDHELEVSDDVLAALSSKAVRLVANVLPPPTKDYGPIGGAFCGNGFAYWTVPVLTLNIRAPFVVVTEENGEKYLTPKFNGGKDCPTLTLGWQPPVGLRVVILIRIQDQVGSVPPLVANSVWMFGLDERFAIHRLPLSNTYENCQVCTGQNVMAGDTHAAAILAVLRVMENAAYNADLWYGAEYTASLFRWKSEGEGFKQLPVKEGLSFRDCLRKVGNEVSKYIAL